MDNPIFNLIAPFLETGMDNLSQNIKILLYKNDPNVFEILDFNKEEIYKEPLFFTFFNIKNTNKVFLNNILAGYTNTKNYLEVLSDNYGRVYIPCIGWFITKFKNEILSFDRVHSKLMFNNEEIDFIFEELQFINQSRIERIKYPIPHLEAVFRNDQKEYIDLEEIGNKQFSNLSKAYELIEKYNPTQFELIEKYASKCVVFKVDSAVTNSFASLSAQGISFYNAYQEDYDEVFFMDDIAHQTGHVIFNALLVNTNEIFTIDKHTILEVVTLENGKKEENRDLFVIFHALYTYYTSLSCLVACLENNVFENRQKHEALGRIALYLMKCHSDLILLDGSITTNEKAIHYFTSEGLAILNEIKKKYIEVYNNCSPLTNHFDLSNQPYNFTYANFIALNPIEKLITETTC